MRLTYIGTIASSLLAAVACLALPQAPSSPAQDGDYVLGALDEIRLTVARHGEYGGTFRIPENGLINFPLIGELRVAGLTIAELERELTNRIAERLNDPKVYVTLVHPRPKRVSVIGLVGNPGVFDLRPGWRVSEAVAAAGGVTLPIEQSICRLFRVDGNDIAVDLGAVLRDGDRDDNILLQEGDTISVLARKTVKVYVAGAVKTPGLVVLDEGMTAVQALAKAGGHTENASLSRAYVTRGGERLDVNLHSVIVMGDTSADVELLQDDVLIVPPIVSRVAVFGEVGSPGWYRLPEEREVRLSDALAQAGGVLKSGVLSRIILLDSKNPAAAKRIVDFYRYLKSGDFAYNPTVKDGDIIVVSANRRGDWEKVFTTVLSLGMVRWLAP